jgi:DNA-3-methyladenine glycosylase
MFMTFTKAEFSPLRRAFYTRPTLTVARELLGKCLVRRIGDINLVGRIVEVEAYIGEGDPACHARFGQTGRNIVMYGLGGFSYVYFIYGMYNMFNVVTERKGFPAAVLIRALEPLEGIDEMRRMRGIDAVGSLTNGPGKLCAALGIDKSHSGVDLTNGNLYVTAADSSEYAVGESSRVGIRKGTDRAWRFFIEGNRFVSGKF